mgnify:CR=1 FL=1
MVVENDSTGSAHGTRGEMAGHLREGRNKKGDEPGLVPLEKSGGFCPCAATKKQGDLPWCRYKKAGGLALIPL